MIGTVTRTSSDGVFVTIDSILPGVELGPLPALVHRYRDVSDSGTSTKTTTYAAGDTVMVIEDSPNDFIVLGILA